MHILLNAIRSYFISQSIRHQLKAGFPDVGLWGLSLNEKQHISVNQVDTLDLINSYGSPLLVVNRSKLLEDAKSILGAIKSLSPNSKVVYSYKTNCVPGILKELHGFGIGAEVISPYELWLAEQLNVPGEDIVYNGVNKTDESLARAIDKGVLAINIDCLGEIDRLVSVARHMNKRVRVGIRLRFSQKSQFGLKVESGDAMEACRRIVRHSEWLELNTVHFCVVSNVKDADAHRHFTEKSLEFIRQIKELTGVVIRYLDIGGGIGVPTSKNMTGTEYGLYRLLGCLPKPPDPEDFENIDMFVERIGKTVREVCSRLNLEEPGVIVEPGRFITSRGEFLLSTVLNIKERADGSKFAITETGRLSLTFPCDFEYHSILPADMSRKCEKELYHVMGRICTSADWMAKNVLLPQLKDGDVLAIMDAGAYFSSYSSNFAFPRPAIVMVDAEGAVELIRKAEDFEHLVANDTVFK